MGVCRRSAAPAQRVALADGRVDLSASIHKRDVYYKSQKLVIWGQS